MNAMTTFTIKSLRANKVRTLVTIAGVVLAAALLTAVLTSYTSLQAMLYEAETRMAGTWMAEVQADDFDGLVAQAQEAQAAGQVNDVAYLRDAGFGELTEQQQNSRISRATSKRCAPCGRARGACPRRPARSCSSIRGAPPATAWRWATLSRCP